MNVVRTIYLCTPRTALQDQYLASSERYVQTTELAKRVQAWEEKIKPALQEQVC